MSANPSPTQLNAVFLVSALLAAMTPLSIAQAAQPSKEDCTTIIGFAIPGVSINEATLQVAQEIPPDPFTGFTGAIPQPASVGKHCLVRGVIDERKGVGGKAYGTRFEMRLPIAWNGKFLFQGGGGVDGFVAPALGTIPCRGATAAPGLVRGYAVVSMNGGHPEPNPLFGFDQQARVDFAYASIGKVTAVSKQVITKLYGAAPKKSVFMGCSNGGREAMIAAQRYPTEFDGVIAGNPGFHLSAANLAEAWDTQQLMSVAPKNAEGQPILARAFSQGDLDLVSSAVLQACDGKDGIADGIINAWQQCNFDPEILKCGQDQSNSCLSAMQVGVLKRVFSGPQNSAGAKLYSDWPYDSGINAPNWRDWKLGRSETPQPDAHNVILGGGSMNFYFLTPPDPQFSQMAFDFDRDPPRLLETARLNDATSTYLSTFAERGSKLVLFQGLSDPVFSANDLLRWYRGVQDTTGNGDLEAVRTFARLFMIPGMTHCGDGPALDDFDPLSALEMWMDEGKAPDFMSASGKAFPGKQQPICAYPRQAIFDGKGDPNKLSSFQCR